MPSFPERVPGIRVATTTRTVSVLPVFDTSRLPVKDDGLTESIRPELLRWVVARAGNNRKVIAWKFNDVLLTFLADNHGDLDTSVLRDMMDTLIQLIHPLPDGDDPEATLFTSTPIKTTRTEQVLMVDRLVSDDLRTAFGGLLIESFIRLGMLQKRQLKQTHLEAMFWREEPYILAKLLESKAFAFVAFSIAPTTKVTNLDTYKRKKRRNRAIRNRR